MNIISMDEAGSTVLSIDEAQSSDFNILSKIDEGNNKMLKVEYMFIES